MKFRHHLKWIGCTWLFFALIVAAFALSGIKMTHISRDPAQIAHFPIYYGFLSNLGVLVWAAGSFIPFFASFLIKEPGQRSLLRWAGILTFTLLLDDFFLIHDSLFPKVLKWPEFLVYAFYLISFSIFFARNAQLILKKTEFRILILGIFVMGISVLIDVNVLPGGMDVEDGFKHFGIVTYCYYWIVTSHRLLARCVAPPSAPQDGKQ